MKVTPNAADNLMVLHHGPEGAEVDEHGYGTCHVCTNRRKLTKEHVPPRAAFNSSPRLWHAMGHDGQNVEQRSVKVRSGFWVRTLCQGCNGDSPHAKEYVRFAKSLAEKPRLFDPSSGRRLLHIAESTHLLAKEIAVMILASEPLSFGTRHDGLRQFVREEKSILNPEFRVFGFLVPDRPESGTIIRVHCRIDGSGEGFEMMAGEISFYPFGFLYAWQLGAGYHPNRLTDITHWFSSTGAKGSVESFDCRITVIDSLQSIYSGPRDTPQIDYVR